MNLDRTKLITAKVSNDDRGVLSAFQLGEQFDFQPMRLFIIHDVKRDRGGHAHKHTDQLIIATSGSVTVRVFNGEGWNQYLLDSPEIGLFMPKMTFVELCEFTPNASCSVLASSTYNYSHSIRTFDEYKKVLGL